VTVRDATGLYVLHDDDALRFVDRDQDCLLDAAMLDVGHLLELVRGHPALTNPGALAALVPACGFQVSGK
jgi:hypothetical protein